MSDQSKAPDPEQSGGDTTPVGEIPADPAVPTGETATATEPAEAPAVADDRLLRLAAEYDNFRRRTQREKAEAADRGAMAVVSRLLDSLDDLDRLDASEAASDEGEAFRQAFGLVKRKLQQSLEAAGLERIAPADVPFDPTEHEAVSVVAPERPEQDHLVKQTLQTGYRFKGMIVRPARVQVYSEQGTA